MSAKKYFLVITYSKEHIPETVQGLNDLMSLKEAQKEAARLIKSPGVQVESVSIAQEVTTVNRAQPTA